jgi:hypothetical protein
MKMNKKISTIGVMVLLSMKTIIGQNNTMGGDKDEHGCRASAGYTFSIIKNDCVRLFEQEIQLDEVGPEDSSISTTAVIFNADSSQVEVFIPGCESGIVLNRTGMEGNYIWKKGRISLLQQGKGYVLKKGKKAIFSS